MKFAFVSVSGALLVCTAFQPTASPASDRVIFTGQQVVYSTANGPLFLNTLVIQQGATLRIVGPNAFRVFASESIRIDGTLDLSGTDHPGVFTLNTPNTPVFGATGGPAAGAGGTGSFLTAAATPNGLEGGDGAGSVIGGGGGGESGYSANTSGNGINRRAAGGGGGLFGPAEPVVAGNLEDPANLGLVALPGVDGSPAAFGALSGALQPKGGAVGSASFVDGILDNDFFGRKAISGGGIIVGELSALRAGQGGGAGGDAIASSVFPPAAFVFSQHDQGAGGGGGGGLGVLVSRKIIVGPLGSIKSTGGDGGGGENTAGVNRIGGGSGAGSGGMLALQAELIDLSQASTDALTALGGSGGPGAGNLSRAIGGGGHGGPGLIQLHVPSGDAANVLLPGGVSLAELSTPTAHVLMIEPNL